jgi:hypothetical protein
MPQLLWVHAADACAYGPHEKPQLPQSCASDVMSTHNGEQHVVPAAHEAPVPQKPTHV